MIPREPQLDYWKAIARIVRRCFLSSLTCNDISPLELATWARRSDSQVRKMQDLSVEFWLLDCGEDTGGSAHLLMLSWPHLCEFVASVTSLSGHHPVGQSQFFESLLRSTDLGGRLWLPWWPWTGCLGSNFPSFRLSHPASQASLLSPWEFFLDCWLWVYRINHGDEE